MIDGNNQIYLASLTCIVSLQRTTFQLVIASDVNQHALIFHYGRVSYKGTVSWSSDSRVLRHWNSASRKFRQIWGEISVRWVVSNSMWKRWQGIAVLFLLGHAVELHGMTFRTNTDLALRQTSWWSGVVVSTLALINEVNLMWSLLCEKLHRESEVLIFGLFSGISPAENCIFFFW